MQQKITRHIKQKTMQCYDTTLLLYTKEKCTVQLFYPQKPALISMKLKTQIKQALLTEKYIYIFGQDVVHKHDKSTRRLLRVILMPNALGILQMNNKSMLVYKERMAMVFSASGHTIWKEEYRYVQQISDCILFIFNDTIRVYRHLEGLIFELSIDELEKRYCPLFNYDEVTNEATTDDNTADVVTITATKDDLPLRSRILKKIFFSIFNNKLYLLCNNRIIGKDLNLYLDDLKLLGFGDASISRFQIISRFAFLFDEKVKRLYMVSKSFSKIFLNVDCDDFYYSTKSDILFVLFNNELKGFEMSSRYKEPFRLISENTVYIEEEDEFDESEISNPDFSC